MADSKDAQILGGGRSSAFQIQSPVKQVQIRIRLFSFCFVFALFGFCLVLFSTTEALPFHLLISGSALTGAVGRQREEVEGDCGEPRGPPCVLPKESGPGCSAEALPSRPDPKSLLCNVQLALSLAHSQRELPLCKLAGRAGRTGLKGRGFVGGGADRE